MPDDEVLRALIDAVGQGQGITQALEFILMEIVRDIARSQPDPQKYLANVFERVSARADQRPIEHEAHPVYAEFRETVSMFFSQAGKGLRTEAPPANGE